MEKKHALRNEYWDKKWETLSLDERTHLQLQSLKKLLEYAKTKSSFYHQYFEGAGFNDINVSSLEDFLLRSPFINKTILTAEQAKTPPFGGFLTVPIQEVARMYYTPGPLLVVLSHEDLKATIEQGAMGLYMAGVRASDIVNVSFNYHWVGGGTVNDDVYRRIGCAVLPGGVGMSETHIELMKLTQATVLAAFPTFAIHLHETAQKMGIDTLKDLSLRLIIIGGEMKTDRDKHQIGEMFGAEVRETYIGNEMGYVGSECPFGGGIHLYSNTIIEVINSETGRRVNIGDPGEIVATVLDKKAMPIINYRTGDITEGLVYGECQCGRNSPKMQRILGRIGNIPRVKGMFIPPQRIELVLSRYKNLGRYQLLIDRQDNKDRLTIRIECPKDDRNNDFKGNLISQFKIALGILSEIEWLDPGTLVEGTQQIKDLRKVV